MTVGFINNLIREYTGPLVNGHVSIHVYPKLQTLVKARHWITIKMKIKSVFKGGIIIIKQQIQWKVDTNIPQKDKHGKEIWSDPTGDSPLRWLKPKTNT